MPRSFLKNFQKKASKFDDSVSGRGVIDLFTIENLAGIKDDSVVSGTPKPNQIYHVQTSFFLVLWTDSDLNFKLTLCYFSDLSRVSTSFIVF